MITQIEAPVDVTLQPGRFRAWLEGQAPEAICGLAHLADRCPLATYLREVHDVGEVLVGTEVYRVAAEPDAAFCDSPPWMVRFVALLDRVPPIGNESCPPVTVAQALAALAWVEATM